MRRLTNILGSVFLGVVVLLCTDYAMVTSKERQLSSTVARLGGPLGSIPCWPIGTEYRISFDRTLQDDEIDALAKDANDMRGTVGIVFRDCAITDEQSRTMRAKLSGCRLFQSQNGETGMTPLSGHVELR